MYYVRAETFLNINIRKLVMRIFHAVVLTGTLLASTNVLAEDKKEEKKSPWTSTAELGFIRTTGNTETQTSAHFEGYGSESEDDNGVNIVSAERYELSGKSDYKFNEFDYMFGLVKLQKDRFSGFEYEDIISLGYGRKVIKQENMELDLEIGPGIRFFKVDDIASDEEAILRLAANYWWKITPTSKFTQELSTEIGEDITSSQTLALKFTYTFKHKTKVPEDNEKVDTELAMTLVYNF